jgi:hypothetical protein
MAQYIDLLRQEEEEEEEEEEEGIEVPIEGGAH